MTKFLKIEAIKHAVKFIEKKIHKRLSLVVSLQANSPEVTAIDIDRSIFHLIKYNAKK